eukprot:CAMPEP_0168181230 /NCGR_PEP_ID=MMETSP0139_2-20121125/11080_1 /TAXON_ID=44445 /ORGANISM="Pseudo-nitzschia australis, Strain 10249 10 AB" /LENGTH=80 /DNA_ID=CAMNT_0008101741 /DNA_START=52 /DNA_END=291 /DNA_ORIENTATION=+
MKFSTCVILAVAAPSVTAFAPVSTNGASSALKAADVVSEVVEEPPTPPPLGPTLNGWTPDADKACFGLPGAISPLGYFDP